MGKPAARLTDMHICPMVTVLVPHVGGPVVGPGVPTVLIGGMPAATMTSLCVCVGPPDVIMLGSTGVFLGGLPAARMGDITAHGGMIAGGLPTVLIGEIDLALLMAGLMILIEKEAIELLKQAIKSLKEILPNLPPAVQQEVNNIIAIIEAAINGDPLVVPHPPGVLVDPPPIVPPPVIIEKTDIACVLEDQDGNPVANEKCEITLPDGSIRNLLTDENGEVRVSGFDPGMCKVSFPDIHADEWS